MKCTINGKWLRLRTSVSMTRRKLIQIMNKLLARRLSICQYLGKILTRRVLMLGIWVRQLCMTDKAVEQETKHTLIGRKGVHRE